MKNMNTEPSGVDLNAETHDDIEQDYKIGSNLAFKQNTQGDSSIRIKSIPQISVLKGHM
jgi:hypothetical protein